MSPVLERVLTPEQRAQAAAEDARQAAALRLHTANFGHLGADRTPALKANAIGDAARETADRLSLTLARGYAHHTTAESLLVALERDSQSMAARCTSVQFAGFQATADGYMRALLRGQVLRLMALVNELRAAPDLLSALQGMVEQECGDKPITDAEHAAVAAIAKATGAQQ